VRCDFVGAVFFGDVVEAWPGGRGLGLRGNRGDEGEGGTAVALVRGLNGVGSGRRRTDSVGCCSVVGCSQSALRTEWRE
jgi:hypothetical protein